MRTDVHESEDGYEMNVDLPGFKKEDIHVDLKEGYLTVSAEKNLEKEEKQEKKVIRSERYVGSMSRSFYVGDVQPESVKCRYENGVLTLEFPKAEQPKLPETHSITIE
jgi:HSP20 family molecular chaperone IbpA